MTISIDAILFDWGGTLAQVDGQVEAFKRGAARILEGFIGMAPEAIVDEMVAAAVEAEKQASLDPEYREVDLAELLREWAGRYGVSLTDEQVSTALTTIGRQWVGAALTVMPHSRETLQMLRRAGLRIALVSNCFIPVEYCRDELQHQNLADLFDCTVFSSEVGYRKPSPRIYEEAIGRISLDGDGLDLSRVLFVGDSPAYDVIAPAAMGMKTALVAASAGVWPAADYERAQPDFRIDSVAELPALLRHLR